MRRPNPEIQAGIVPSKPKKRKPAPHPAASVTISPAEKRDIQRIRRGPQPGRATAIPTNFKPSTKDLSRDQTIWLEQSQNPDVRAIRGPGGFFENVGNAYFGKSLTNTIFHGDTSHPGASALELGMALPYFKGPRILGKIVTGLRAGKKTKGAIPVENAVADAFKASQAGRVVGKGAIPVAKPPSVADVLPAAKKARATQEAGYSVERGKRFKEAGKAFGQAGGGLAGHHAAKGMLRGELPKVDFNLLREGDYTQAMLDRDMNLIYEHPGLTDGNKTSAGDAIENMFLHGHTPQKAQIKLLGTVFGHDEAAKLVAQTLGGRVQDVLGLMRSLQTTLDLSLNMRQALPLLFRSPNIWRKSAAPQIKALLKEKNFKQADNLLRSDPDFQLAQRVQPRLFTSIEGRAGVDRSEYFPSTFAEKIPLVKHPVRASGRAFEIGQNMGILNSFKSMMARAEKWGVNINPDTADGLRELKGMLDVAGAQVGRGVFKTKMFKGAQPLLSQGLYAPSFYKSRLTWFSPRWYIKLPKVARYEAIRTMAQFAGGTSAVLYGAHAAGAGVAIDPRSSDFGKIRLGNTRLDAMGGFQQWARMTAQLMPEKLYGGDTWSGKYVDTNTGEVKTFQPGIGNRTRWDALVAFATGKASPLASLIIDAFKGTDYQYRPFEWKRAVYSRMLPLVAQDVLDVYKQTGSVPAAVAAYGASATGVGVQTYTNTPEKKQADAFKKWQTQAEKDLGHPLAPGLLLAKHKADLVSAEQQRLKSGTKLTYKEKLEARINVLIETNSSVDAEMLRRTLDQVDEQKAKVLIPDIEQFLGYGYLHALSAERAKRTAAK